MLGGYLRVATQVFSNAFSSTKSCVTLKTLDGGVYIHTLRSVCVLGSTILGSVPDSVFDQCPPCFWLDLNLLIFREPILSCFHHQLPVPLSRISQKDSLDGFLPCDRSRQEGWCRSQGPGTLF